jgi:hypothetical protein
LVACLSGLVVVLAKVYKKRSQSSHPLGPYLLFAGFPYFALHPLRERAQALLCEAH